MVPKRSITLHGRRTSLSLEAEFWDALKDIAKSRRTTVAAVLEFIDAERDAGTNISSATRLFILQCYRRPKR